MKLHASAPILLGLLLAACVLRAPVIEKPTLRNDAPLKVDGLQAGEWPAARWWERYQDPTLNALIDQALRSAPSLNTASARFASARESIRVTGAAQGVQIEADAAAQRQRLSDNGLFPPALLGFHWYNQADLGLSAKYTFDWWGKQRANVAAAVDEAHATQAERSAAALILASSIADNYFAWQADQARLTLAQERLAIVERQANIANVRLNAQIDSPDNAQIARQSIASSRSEIAAIETSARLHIVALAALLGQAPNELPALTTHPLPAILPTLPANAGLDLIAKRPDIVASRWRVEAAGQNLIVARSDYFPDISIHALAGLSSVDLGTLLKYDSRVPALGIAIHLPLYDSGLRAARFGARQAMVRAAVASYNETVVDAAREVATAAANAAQITTQLNEQQAQLNAATALQKAAAARVSAGVTDVRPRLLADLSLLAQRDAITQLTLAAVSADIGLQRVLGGGFEFKEQQQ